MTLISWTEKVLREAIRSAAGAAGGPEIDRISTRSSDFQMTWLPNGKYPRFSVEGVEKHARRWQATAVQRIPSRDSNKHIAGVAEH